MSKKLIIAIVVLSIIVIGLLAYVFLGNQVRGDFRQPSFQNMSGFSLTDEIKASTVEFFDSPPSLEDAKTYCDENRINCFYYCTEVNQEHEVCSDLAPPEGRQGFGSRR